MKLQGRTKKSPARANPLPAIIILLVLAVLTFIVYTNTHSAPAERPYLPVIWKQGEDRLPWLPMIWKSETSSANPMAEPTQRDAVWAMACAWLAGWYPDLSTCDQWRDACFMADDIFTCLCGEAGGILDGEGGCIIIILPKNPWEGYRPCDPLEIGISDGKRGCWVPAWAPTATPMPPNQ